MSRPRVKHFLEIITWEFLWAVCFLDMVDLEGFARVMRCTAFVCRTRDWIDDYSQKEDFCLRNKTKNYTRLTHSIALLAHEPPREMITGSLEIMRTSA